MAQKVSLTSHQLEALDRLIARGKDISIDELPDASAGPKCWLDTAVSVVTVVTAVAGCAGSAYKAEKDSAGKERFTLHQLKDLRYRATQI